MNSKKHAVKLLSAISFLFVFIFLAEPVSAQGKKRGKVTTKYPNGMKASQGKVKNYKKEGEWKYWTDEGALQKVEHYKNDAREGLSTSYYASGQKSEEGNYLGGRKDGAWNAWYNSGSPSSKLNYDGKNYTDEKMSSYEGLQQWFYENGQLREESNYVNHNVVSRRTFYQSGKKKSIEYFKDGAKSGTWRLYQENAADTLPRSIDTYLNGKKDGLHLAYLNGHLAEEWNYRNGKYEGSVKTWDYKGDISAEENYVDGKLEGLCRYYNRGKCIREGNYHNGKPEGEEKEYSSNGKMFRQSWFRYGKPDSVLTFHPNGKIATSRAYSYYPGFVHTEEFSDYREWDTTGVLLLHGTYHFEQKDKEWTTYYANKKIKSLTSYSNGKMTGIYKKWYSNGKLMIEMKVEGNYATETPKVWDERGKPVKPGTKYYEEIVDSSKPGEIYNDPKQIHPGRINFTPPEITDVEADGVEEAPPEVVGTIEETPAEEVFQFAEVMPEFPGGQSEMNLFIQKNIKYPAQYVDEQKQGTVYVQFTVSKDGALKDVKVVKGVTGCPLFDAEAIRVISVMPKWNPGKMNGRNVAVRITQPVKFIMN